MVVYFVGNELPTLGMNVFDTVHKLEEEISLHRRPGQQVLLEKLDVVVNNSVNEVEVDLAEHLEAFVSKLRACQSRRDISDYPGTGSH